MARKASLADLIEALPEDLRDLVVERASIIFDSGTAWDEAERLAYVMETGRALPGIAKATEREAVAAPRSAKKKSSSR